MGPVGPVSILDANVLWSAAVRDTLLLSAEHHLFQPRWTQRILDEVALTLKRKRPDLRPERIDRTIDQLLRFFPDALVDDYSGLLAAMRNHPGDRHVLAAAVRVDAAAIVTWNVTHFPADACDPYGIDVQTPDEFLSRLRAVHPALMVAVLRQQAGHLLNPPRSLDQILDTLARALPAFVGQVRGSGLL